MLSRVLAIAGHHEKAGEIELRRGVIGVNGDDAPQQDQSVCVIPFLNQAERQIGENVGGARLRFYVAKRLFIAERNGGPKVIESLSRLSAPNQQRCEIIVRRLQSGIPRHRLLKGSLRLSFPPERDQGQAVLL